TPASLKDLEGAIENAVKAFVVSEQEKRRGDKTQAESLGSAQKIDVVEASSSTTSNAPVTANDASSAAPADEQPVKSLFAGPQVKAKQVEDANPDDIDIEAPEEEFALEIQDATNEEQVVPTEPQGTKQPVPVN